MIIDGITVVGELTTARSLSQTRLGTYEMLVAASVQSHVSGGQIISILKQ